MALTATLVRYDRRAERETLDVAGTLRHVANGPIDVVIEDLSITGFRIRTTSDLKLHEEVTIGIPGIGQHAAHVVRRVDDGFGCEFASPIDPTLLAVPLHAQPVVEAQFGGDLNVQSVREWSRANPPQVERFAPGRGLLIIAGLGIASWLAVLGAVSPF